MNHTSIDGNQPLAEPGPTARASTSSARKPRIGARHAGEPRVASIGTALPENVLTQRDAKAFASHMFGEAFGGEIERLIGIFDNSDIRSRHFCMPLEWYAESRSFRQKNDLYVERGLDLASEAIATCLERVGLEHGDIDYILFVSTTGIATPSMDARLIQRLPFKRTIKRLPIWGLGCAGGAASLSRAMEIARAVPTARILVVVLELCGLTFMRNDLSKAALIATSLFADGAAAVVVAGAEAEIPSPRRGPAILASHTSTLDDSLDVMGWDIGGEGLKVVISRDIPTIVKTFMKGAIDELLEREGLRREDIVHYVAHPGGAKVIQAYEDSLDLPADRLRHTREVLATCGNISACSVMFVLERFIDELDAPSPGDAQSDLPDDRAEPPVEYGLLGALGPGFSAELVLLAW